MHNILYKSIHPSSLLVLCWLHLLNSDQIFHPEQRPLHRFYTEPVRQFFFKSRPLKFIFCYNLFYNLIELSLYEQGFFSCISHLQHLVWIFLLHCFSLRSAPKKIPRAWGLTPKVLHAKIAICIYKWKQRVKLLQLHAYTLWQAVYQCSPMAELSPQHPDPHWARRSETSRSSISTLLASCWIVAVVEQPHAAFGMLMRCVNVIWTTTTGWLTNVKC